MAEGIPGINVDLGLSASYNGQLFTVGERAVLTVKLTDGCGGVFIPSEMGTA